MDVPGRWLHAYAQMRPRIEAERALAQISVVAAGNGLMEKSDQRQYLTDLRRTASGGRMPKAAPATMASLLEIGVKIVDEPTSAGGVVLPRGVKVVDGP
jgi:hypothetical protein